MFSAEVGCSCCSRYSYYNDFMLTGCTIFYQSNENVTVESANQMRHIVINAVSGVALSLTPDGDAEADLEALGVGVSSEVTSSFFLLCEMLAYNL